MKDNYAKILQTITHLERRKRLEIQAQVKYCRKMRKNIYNELHKLTSNPELSYDDHLSIFMIDACFSAVR
jgi:hypothetical protein